MTEKKELNVEDIEKVSGGLKRDLDRLQYDLTKPEGGAIYNAPADGAKGDKNDTSTDGDTAAPKGWE